MKIKKKHLQKGKISAKVQMSVCKQDQCGDQKADFYCGDFYCVDFQSYSHSTAQLPGWEVTKYKYLIRFSRYLSFIGVFYSLSVISLQLLYNVNKWIQFNSISSQSWWEKLFFTVATCYLPLHWLKGHMAHFCLATSTLWTSTWILWLAQLHNWSRQHEAVSSRDTVTLEVEAPSSPTSSQLQPLSRLL